jgi:tetratricopeptide (TPR) repeat protein
LYRLISTAATLLALCLAGAAAAGDDAACQGPGDDAIDACVRMMESKAKGDGASKYDRAIGALPLDAKRGIAWLGKGDFDRAFTEFERAIRLNPDTALVYAIRGIVHDVKGEKDRAHSDFSEAIRLGGDDALDAVCSNVFGSLTRHDTTLADDEIAACTRMIARHPNDAATYVSRGAGYEQKGDPDRAIADYGQAIALDPNNVSAYHRRASIYSDKGDHDRAIADYDQVIRLDPKDRLVRLVRGSLYFLRRDYGRTIADYDQAISLDPKDAAAYALRGKAYAYKGEQDRARSDFDEAVRLGDERVFSTICSISFFTDYVIPDDDRIAACSRALKADPKEDLAFLNRGLAYFSKGEYDAAIADIDQAINLRPHSIYYVNRAAAYMRKGAYDRAIADDDQAIVLDPKFATAFDKRGDAYNAKGAYDRAIADYGQAIALDPKNAGYYKDRGSAYHRKGAYDQAIADFDQALKLDPDLAAARENLERSHAALAARPASAK